MEQRLRATEFALRSADALAANLNLRRTARCVVHLAVPYFANWAGLTVVDGARLRRVDSAGVDDFGDEARPRKLLDLDAAAAARLRAGTAGPTRHGGRPSTDVVEAFGLPPGAAEGLADSGAVLVTVPLSLPSGGGVLALVGSREPDADELRSFADRATRALTAAYTFEERGTLARTLRRALMPDPLPAIEGIELGAAYRPAQESTEIGGDFYDVTPRPDGSWSVSIGDVCGKGVDAAVLTGQTRQSLRTASLVTDDPTVVLGLLNDTLLRSDGSTFATVAYGVLSRDPGGVRLRLASGGHPPPWHVRDGAVSTVSVHGTLIGILPDVSFHTAEVELRDGDLLLLYTDGAVEARGPSGVLGPEPIAGLLADCTGLTAQAVTERVLQFVMEHLQGWPHDDIALLALRCASNRAEANGR